ncbi:MAG: hypothetical protein MUF10_20685 [Thermoanaerobaculaceae bacterium]|nr:hypothetical protein [Thermoanaerobaculaceae bacterium]
MSAEAVWAGWLALFLVYEVTAALRERGTDQRLTLSRVVWRWFDTVIERLALAFFLAVLTAHLVLGWPGGLAVILTGAPVALLIVLALLRRGPTAAVVVLALPLLLGADRCSVSWPQPQPTPTLEPTLEPTPKPTPTPTPGPQSCADLACPPDQVCIHEVGRPPYCAPAPFPTPSPTPTPPSATCSAPLNGTPNMGIYWYSPQRVADATPRLCDADRCRAVGYPDRICCPVVPDEHPERARCECLVMTGVALSVCAPTWELAVDEGPLAWDFDDTGWKAVMSGHGKGRIRACWPNGRTCSKWLEVDR